MSKEHWIVKNNTGGYLCLPKLGLSFKEHGHEKELCFLTGKTIEELENNSEIISNIKSNNLITIAKVTNDKILNELNEIKNIINTEKESIPQITQVQQIDLSAIVDVIRNEIKSAIGSNIVGQTSKEIVSYNDENVREQAIHQLIFKGKDTSIKNFEELGFEKEVINESEGNEDLLGDL